ncbi:signal transduction histidine kinase [Thioflavicoccus mobilis 8321]|uniref:histidine kinase n=1 Tax=Thioflavicoccus mobilis 8321 TaxID=765912 RepID=L0GSX0_9GAMM|nr:HAMP domain-containing sensor histidine kinase [Thioflavicoccus mobilis]AGA89091.1 signal transduction histidine kinase [Thioflavicoccus mobilis 8321]
MSVRRSLRNRVAITLAAFAALVSLSLATLMYLASHDLERRLVDETLNAELDDYIARRERNPRSLPAQTATIRAFVVAENGGTMPIPPAVAALSSGRHELVLDGRPYRAAVRRADDRRFVVLFDVGALQRRERLFLLLLSVSVVLITVVSALSGRWLATAVIAPVTRLARRVAGLQPGEAPPPLAGEFPWYEVQELAADFDDYLARLHAFSERERLFTGDVSHELRTPLAVAAGAAELLAADPSLGEHNRARVARIGRAVAEMGEMTAALLALAREQGTAVAQPQPVSCDVALVAGELIERYRELFRAKPVTLTLEVRAHPQLAADRAVLSMVLGNLVRNALGFTQEGEVAVRIEADALEVSDTGPGISRVIQRHGGDLFRPYVRGPDSDGAGLGLSLVQRLCVHQGWQVGLTGRPGGGTVARLVFGGAGLVDL